MPPELDDELEDEELLLELEELDDDEDELEDEDDEDDEDELEDDELEDDELLDELDVEPPQPTSVAVASTNSE